MEAIWRKKRWRQRKKIKRKDAYTDIVHFYDSLPGRHKHSILSSSEVEVTMYACTWLGQSPTILPRIKLLFASWLIFDEIWTQKGFCENRAKRNKSSSERAWASAVTLYIIHVTKTFASGVVRLSMTMQVNILLYRKWEGNTHVVRFVYIHCW